MTWLEFIAEMTKALAWPASAIVLMIVMRKPLVELLPKLAKLKWKDLELDFSKRVSDAEELLPAALPNPSATVEGPLIALAETSPRAAVLESWLRVERAVVEVAKQRGLPIPKSEARVVNDIIRSGALDGWQMGVLKDLRGLRNSAVHVAEFEPSKESAIGYVRLALELEQSLNPGVT